MTSSVRKTCAFYIDEIDGCTQTFLNNIITINNAKKTFKMQTKKFKEMNFFDKQRNLRTKFSFENRNFNVKVTFCSIEMLDNKQLRIQ